MKLGPAVPEAAPPLPEADGEAFMRGYEMALRNAGGRAIPLFRAGMPDTMRFSYTSLVHRTPMGLRIKVEDESTAPPRP